MKFEEQVSVTVMHKHSAALVNETRVYAKATSSSVCFTIAENERMVKELQVAKQGGELVTMSVRDDLNKAILDEVLSLVIVMEHCTPSLVLCIM